MTNRAALFCALALSLALVSTFMIPVAHHARAAAPVMTGHVTPMHSLTGISFHAVAGL